MPNKCMNFAPDGRPTRKELRSLPRGLCMALAVREMSDSDAYADDEEHAIPFLGRIDVFVTTKEGNVMYGLVIASPLSGDTRSQQRLIKKLEDYLSDRHSADLRSRFGAPTPSNTSLKVAIHPGSDPTVFELLRRCKPWIEDNGFSLEVTSDATILSLH
jgi:hypothetical protein